MERIIGVVQRAEDTVEVKRCMCNRVHFPTILRSFEMQRYKERCTSRVFMFILIDVRCSSSEYIQLDA